MEAPRKPRCIGLTGAIGSGKSATLAALEELGADTLSTDEVSHELMNDPELVTQLVDRWGADVAPDGKASRDKVGAIVFADRDELRWLESVMHPLVGKRVWEWREALAPEAQLGVVEVPLLFEANMDSFFDGVLVVVAGERRTAWLEARGDTGVEGRSGRQLTEEEKASRATWVVANDGTLDDLRDRLREMWPELTVK